MIYIVRGEKADAPVCSPHCDLSAAIRLAAAMEARGSTVRIFSVGEDGAETMLPTFEEAIEEIAALRADLASMRDIARCAILTQEQPLICRSCGKVAEEDRRCYAQPTCHACLPPPPALPVLEIQ